MTVPVLVSRLSWSSPYHELRTCTSRVLPYFFLAIPFTFRSFPSLFPLPFATGHSTLVIPPPRPISPLGHPPSLDLPFNSSFRLIAVLFFPFRPFGFLSCIGSALYHGLLSAASSSCSLGLLSNNPQSIFRIASFCIFEPHSGVLFVLFLFSGR